jgi:hypothetical protein
MCSGILTSYVRGLTAVDAQAVSISNQVNGLTSTAQTPGGWASDSPTIMSQTRYDAARTWR